MKHPPILRSRVCALIRVLEAVSVTSASATQGCRGARRWSEGICTSEECLFLVRGRFRSRMLGCAQTQVNETEVLVRVQLRVNAPSLAFVCQGWFSRSRDAWADRRGQFCGLSHPRVIF